MNTKIIMLLILTLIQTILASLISSWQRAVIITIKINSIMSMHVAQIEIQPFVNMSCERQGCRNL